ncbi:YhbY family RNA-binding protein [Elusimicrobiota bacterium]
MLTGYQKRYLRAAANKCDASLIIGKEGITPSLIKELDSILENKELVKISVLKTSPLNRKEIAEQLPSEVNAELVQVIGRKIVLFRRSSDSPEFILPLHSKEDV